MGYDDAGRLIRRKTFKPKINVEAVSYEKESPFIVHIPKSDNLNLEKQIYHQLKEMLANENITNQEAFAIHMTISNGQLRLDKPVGFMPWDIKQAVDNYLKKIHYYPSEFYRYGTRNITAHYTLRFRFYE